MSLLPAGLMMLGVLLTPILALAQTGDAAAGKALWSGNTQLCRQCHGANGEGGFGPDLAGRSLSVSQFTRAVRQPWGIMPAFVPQQVSDAQINDLVAYFASLPRVSEPAAWRVPLAPTMSASQRTATALGCTQCHGPDFAVMRQALGAVSPDFAWFSRLVYTHTTSMPELEMMLGDSAPIRMGDFSPLRIPEPVMQDLWKFISVDLGFRPRVQARLAPGVAAAAGTMFTATVTNGGVPGRGLNADDVIVALTIAPGSTIVASSGPGYQGVQKDERGADVATWRVPRLETKAVQSFSLTLGGSAAAIQAGNVSWVKPAPVTGDPRDRVNVQLPPRPMP